MRSLLTQLKADWDRHKASASLLSMPALANYRFGVWVHRQPVPVRWVGGKMYGLGTLVTEVLSGISVDRNTQIGEDIHFVHAGGIQIHPAAKLGDRVGIMHGVTIGTGPAGGAPVIGNDVFLGANCSVIGAVTIGDNARVAANSLVVSDVPPGALAIGVPAKVVPQLKTKLRPEKPKKPPEKPSGDETKSEEKPAPASSATSGSTA